MAIWGQQTIVGSRHTNWFEIGELEEVPSSLWLTQGGLGCSTLFFVGNVGVIHRATVYGAPDVLCIGPQHTVGGENLSPCWIPASAF